MSVSTTKMTAEQYFQLGEDPPGVRLELVNGDVAVSPSPTPNHSFAVLQLSHLLLTHIESHNLGELHHDVDTLLDPLNVRRPDLLYFSKTRMHLIGAKYMEGPPDLAVEVISPSSIQIDRDDKFVQYQQAGVAHYWIVDPQQQTIQGWTLEGNAYQASGGGKNADVVHLPPFADLDIPLQKLWRPSPPQG